MPVVVAKVVVVPDLEPHVIGDDPPPPEINGAFTAPAVAGRLKLYANAADGFKIEIKPDPGPTLIPADICCGSVNVCAKLSSAIVPVFAGKVAVTVPSAPVAGCKVIVPEVAFLKATDPTVDPSTPTVTPLFIVAAPVKLRPQTPAALTVPRSRHVPLIFAPNA